MSGKTNSDTFALEAHRLSKSFGTGAKLVRAVNDVSLTISEGETLAFLGRNGAGKTTTISMIAGLLEPDSGTVLIGGQPITDRKVLATIGCVLEGSRNLQLQLTCMENLEYYAALKGLSLKEGRTRGAELLEMFDLTHKTDSRVRELSRGMLQKVSVAVSLIHRPKLLLLDEPTNGLDVESSEHIKEVLKRLTNDGLAVLLTTHQLDVAQELSGNVAIIRDGEIILKGNTEELLQMHSGTTAIVQLRDEIPHSIIDQLAAIGVTATAEGSVLKLDNGEGKLYEALDLLRPNPIISIEPEAADLTDVFLDSVRTDERRPA